MAISCLDCFFFNAGMFDMKSLMQQVPSIDFNKCFIDRLKVFLFHFLGFFYVLNDFLFFQDLELAANWERSVNLQDFIMDELSILQYRRKENQWNEEVDCKLIVIDFLESEEGQSNQFCSKCEQMAEKLKLCGACRSVLYCSVKCQKSDWSIHKLVCSKLAKK